MRLLVIDDEEDICETIAEIASTRGIEVDTISDPALVSEKIDTFTPDIVVLDLLMPGTDGVELLRLLASKVRSAKVCLMSGSDARVLNSARRLGSAHGLNVIAALEKPLDVNVIRATFDQITKNSPAMLSTDITQALAQGQFVLYYQPEIEMATRRVKGVEALVRWAHPLTGLMMPGEFLGRIKGEGLMQSLSDYVLDQAVQQAAKWHKMGHSLTVSVNFTTSTLMESGLPDKLIKLCQQHELPPEMLVLEVTETEAMRDITKAMDVLLRMRIRNIGISVDDFGTGHSSLRELQRMPFSEIKIDKSFILDMVSNKEAGIIVNSIIDLGHNLGLRVIAEGVEDQRLWDMLMEKKCDFAQGFYIAKPMPAADVVRWLTNWQKAGV